MDETKAMVRVIDIQALEELDINANRRLNMDEKKRLFELLRKVFERKEHLLRQSKEEIKQAIIAQAKERSGWDKKKAELRRLESKASSLKQQIELLQEDIKESTGFDSDGDLVDAQTRQLINGKWQVVINKYSTAVEKKVDLACQEYDQYEFKFDKIEAKLLLADTYGDARKIMNAVMGNGDFILSQ